MYNGTELRAQTRHDHFMEQERSTNAIICFQQVNKGRIYGVA